MQFLIEKDALIDPLGRVSSVIDTGPTIPILAQVLIESTDDGIRLCGSNIDMEANETIDNVDISEGGRIVCNAQLLLEYCRQQHAGSRLNFSQVEQQLTVENIDAKASSRPNNANGDATTDSEGFKNALTETSLDADDFPSLNVSDDEWIVQFDIDRFALRNILKRTEHAMGTNEPRMYLNATLLEIYKNLVRAVTTDGHRLAFSETQLDADLGEIEERHRAVLPRKTALELSKVLGSLTSRVTVRIKNTHIQVFTPHYSFTSKLLEGAFPDWQAAIPSELELAFRAERSEFAKGLKQIGILGLAQKDISRAPIAAKILVNQGRLDMRADNVQKQVEHTMLVDENQQRHKFQANYRYMLDALEAMPDCETVDIYLKETHSACQLRFPEDASTSFLVMLLKDN